MVWSRFLLALLFLVLMGIAPTLAQPNSPPPGEVKWRVLVHAIEISPDGKTLAVGLTGVQGDKYEPRLIELWDIATGKRLRTFETKEEQNDLLLFSPDSKRLASVGLLLDGVGTRASVWEMATGNLICRLEPDKPTDSLWGLSFTADGNHIAGTLTDIKQGRPISSSVCVWDSVTGKRERQFSISPNLAVSATYLDNARSILASTWRREESTVISSLLVMDSHHGTITRSLSLGQIPTYTVSLSPDGQTLALPYHTAIPDQIPEWHVELRDWRSDRSALPLEMPVADTVVTQFTPDSKQLLAAGRLIGQPQRSELWRWDTQTGERLATVALGDYTAGPFTCAISPDSKLLAMPGTPGKLLVRNTSDGELVKEFDLLAGDE